MKNENFQNFVKNYQKKYNFSVNELIEKLNISKQYLYQLYNKERPIGEATKNKLISIFKLNKIEIDELTKIIIRNNIERPSYYIKFQVRDCKNSIINMFSILRENYKTLTDNQVDKIIKVLGE